MSTTPVLAADGHPPRPAALQLAGVMQGLDPATLELTAALLERRWHVGGCELRLVRKPDGVVCVSPARNAAASSSLLGVRALLAGTTVVVGAPHNCPLGVAWAWRELVAPALATVGAAVRTSRLQGISIAEGVLLRESDFADAWPWAAIRPSELWHVG